MYLNSFRRQVKTKTDDRYIGLGVKCNRLNTLKTYLRL